MCDFNRECHRELVATTHFEIHPQIKKLLSNFVFGIGFISTPRISDLIGWLHVNIVKLVLGSDAK
jgi:hypothetical protein